MAPRNTLRSRASLLPVGLVVIALCVSTCILAQSFLQFRPPTEDVVQSRRDILLGIAGGLAAGLGSAQAANAQMDAMPAGGLWEFQKERQKKYEREVDTKQIIAMTGENLGSVASLKSNCFETDNNGKTAEGLYGVIAWDADSDCGKGKAFIHAVGKSQFFPMTAAKGNKTRHTYYAASFGIPGLTKYNATEGTCQDTPTGGKDTIKWQVANTERGGECYTKQKPAPPPPPPRVLPPLNPAK
eukprot:TRINITY_DN97075_c0_g1_i1.p1 TRINITY_DN97075_c0_g1~~TRINITY_DN97075_c0_g1_i1.p1  ORF type:complete len:242 (+),score=49.16 TRINITY_DN97075_c0_g1_i1:65-790(+)